MALLHFFVYGCFKWTICMSLSSAHPCHNNPFFIVCDLRAKNGILSHGLAGSRCKTAIRYLDFNQRHQLILVRHMTDKWECYLNDNLWVDSIDDVIPDTNIMQRCSNAGLVTTQSNINIQSCQNNRLDNPVHAALDFTTLELCLDFSFWL